MHLTPHLPDLRRRRIVGVTLAVGAGALLASARLLAQERALRATPAVALGPFYPDRLPSDRTPI